MDECQRPGNRGLRGNCQGSRVFSASDAGSAAVWDGECSSVTWSIIARDSDTAKFGIAVATKFFAVGALVPHLQARIGAVATQALINPFYGVHGLALLREGKSAAEAVQVLVAGDGGRDHRQL